MSLDDLGWDSRLETAFEVFRHQGLEPARVCRADRELYHLFHSTGLLRATVSGRFRHGARTRADLPAVGDWVAVEARPNEGRATIHAVLPRASCFSRKVAGETTEEQVVAANVDTVLLMCGLDGDFNPRRIERYLTAAWESGATPVILLNKTDLCEDPDARTAEIEAIAAGVAVHALSALRAQGLDVLSPYLASGRTVALLGSSGVGKSTLVNALLGEDRQATGEVREDDQRGRHTTTHRELIPLPGGALLLDTPGMRELQLWGEGDGLEAAFEDIESLAGRCRFRDCAHAAEPGCAVHAAIADGSLDPDRFSSWRKLQREQRAFAARHDQRLRRERKAYWKSITKAVRDRPNRRT